MRNGDLKMKKYYEMEIAGLKRSLPLFCISDTTEIAAFIIFGDVELTVHCAKKLLEIAPEYDVLMTAEAKSIPLIHEMARQAGKNEYIIARKGPKLYMEDILTVDVKSITTSKQQILCIGKKEKEMIEGKRVLIVDDVISTGESLASMEKLVKLAGGAVAGKLAVLAEGNAMGREDIKVLAPLPLFDADGNPKTL